jgi:hypothetical protein
VRVQVADIRIFVEVYGQEWVAHDARMRRRPVLLALHGSPGWDATGLRCAARVAAGRSLSPAIRKSAGAAPRVLTAP